MGNRTVDDQIRAKRDRVERIKAALGPVVVSYAAIGRDITMDMGAVVDALLVKLEEQSARIDRLEQRTVGLLTA